MRYVYGCKKCKKSFSTTGELPEQIRVCRECLVIPLAKEDKDEKKKGEVETEKPGDTL